VAIPVVPRGVGLGVAIRFLMMPDSDSPTRKFDPKATGAASARVDITKRTLFILIAAEKEEGEAKIFNCIDALKYNSYYVWFPNVFNSKQLDYCCVV